MCRLACKHVKKVILDNYIFSQLSNEIYTLPQSSVETYLNMIKCCQDNPSHFSVFSVVISLLVVQFVADEDVD